MEIAHWKDERYKGDVCPKCRMLNQNFPILGATLFSYDVKVQEFLCMTCGTIFVPKSERSKIDIKALMNPLTCTCGKVCKSKAGLESHKRSCNDTA